MSAMIVAIDGPAVRRHGCAGARPLTRVLYLDTGAMYRR
jgi:cytidylate kinase